MSASLQPHSNEALARKILTNIVHSGCLGATNIQYALSPLTSFSGDLLLADLAPNGTLHLLLADVTGHGISAAMGGIPVAQLFYQEVCLGVRPETLVYQLNKKLFSMLPRGAFVACIYIVFDFKQQIFKIFNAGMPNGYRLRWNFAENPPHLLCFPSKALALGILSPQQMEVQFDWFPFEASDMLFLCSDGVIEQQNIEGKMLGRKGMETMLHEIKGDQAVLPALLKKIEHFSKDAEKTDDSTLIAIDLREEVIRPFTRLYASGQSSVTGDRSFRFVYSANCLKQTDPFPALFHMLIQHPFLAKRSQELYAVLHTLFQHALVYGLLGIDFEPIADLAALKAYWDCVEERRLSLEKREITVKVTIEERPKKEVLLFVSLENNGRGFNAEKLQKIMQMHSVKECSLREKEVSVVLEYK